jgi:hypothetical protein
VTVRQLFSYHDGRCACIQINRITVFDQRGCTLGDRPLGIGVEVHAQAEIDLHADVGGLGVGPAVDTAHGTFQFEFDQVPANRRNVSAQPLTEFCNIKVPALEE